MKPRLDIYIWLEHFCSFALQIQIVQIDDQKEEPPRGNAVGAELPDVVRGGWGTVIGATAAGERQPGHRGRRAPRPGAPVCGHRFTAARAPRVGLAVP